MLVEGLLHRVQLAVLVASPSMVTISAPSAWTASTVQDFTALPSTRTTQAPHCDVSQPTWVPVRPSVSRSILDEERPVLDRRRTQPCR